MKAKIERGTAMGKFAFLTISIVFSLNNSGFAQDAGKILFASNRDGDREIYMMDGDGTNPLALTESPGTSSAPKWSPDGRLIAFQSDRDGNFEIYVMKADGSDQTRLTENTAIDVIPSWSPDGRHLVFQTNRDGNEEIYVMAADGSDQTRITDDPAADWNPSWSPDGRYIAFTSNRGGSHFLDIDIYIASADGSDLSRLTQSPGPDVVPQWSPDSHRLVFVSFRGWGDPEAFSPGSWSPEKMEIYTINTDGSQPIRLTDNDYWDDLPVWSPDGAQIAFMSTRTGDAEIWSMATDGSNPTNLSLHPSEDGPPGIDWGLTEDLVTAVDQITWGEIKTSLFE